MRWWDRAMADSLISYPDHLEEGAAACDYGLSRPGLPADAEEAFRKNATWYAPILPSRLLWSQAWYAGWHTFNPSLAAAPDGELAMIIRTANYHIHPGGRYEMPAADDGVIKTTNYLATVRVAPEAAEVGAFRRLNDDAIVNPDHPFPVQGIEDCRLFWRHEGDVQGWWASGTVRDHDEAGICTMVAAPLEEDGFGPPHSLSNGHYHDKNWMPLVGEWSRFVDRVYPLTIRGLDPPLITQARDAPFLLRNSRGGAQVLRHEGHWLGLVHDAIGYPEDPERWRLYTHRFIRWDADWHVKEMSRPFIFHHRGIEFAAGMVIHGDDLLISYGADDAEARLIAVRLEDVWRALKKREPPTREA